jgi:hypothetical protein
MGVAGLRDTVPPTISHGTRKTGGRLTLIRTDAFEERAAVLEYDAGLTRAEAEAQARAELVTEAGPDDELSDLDF